MTISLLLRSAMFGDIVQPNFRRANRLSVVASIA
jgi:hypothetical protein